MHKRINESRQCKVVIFNDDGNGTADLSASPDRLHFEFTGEAHHLGIDRPAVEALVDALHCWLDTQDFAALEDTSAVPYVGKKMLRLNSYTKREEYLIKVVAMNTGEDRKRIVCIEDDDQNPVTGVEVSDLLPLVAPSASETVTPDDRIARCEKGLKDVQKSLESLRRAIEGGLSVRTVGG